MNMEWLNHSAGLSGLGMSSTGSSHCRQYMVDPMLTKVKRFTKIPLAEGGGVYPTALGWRNSSQNPDFSVLGSYLGTAKGKV